MKPSNTADRVKKHRDALREKGLKPVQIWVPDTRRKGFSEECKKQALLVKNSEADIQIDEFLDDAADLRGWE